MSLVCLRTFQKPLHFERTGVRVVAMCPGYTISNISGDENKYLVADWNTLEKRKIYQPYALQLILINHKPLIESSRKHYLVICPRRDQARRQYTFLMHLLWYESCYSGFLTDSTEFGFYSFAISTGNVRRF